MLWDEASPHLDSQTGDTAWSHSVSWGIMYTDGFVCVNSQNS